jgi:hypothetical protein
MEANNKLRNKSLHLQSVDRQTLRRGCSGQVVVGMLFTCTRIELHPTSHNTKINSKLIKKLTIASFELTF